MQLCFLPRFSWPLLALLATAAASAQQPQSPARHPSDKIHYAIALHGGAGGSPERLSPQQQSTLRQSLERALRIGQQILAQGGTSLDAVEQVIRYLEDDPQFNAGRGAVLNSIGGHELDASIMDGRTKACGAVAGVTTVKNPISLARLVMTRTRHILLGGAGAERFASQMGVQRVDQKYFRTERRYRVWLKARQKEQTNKEDQDGQRGTVGCVALDQHGNLAAGTSTGGLTNKMFGRIGDSPIIGAGTYADNATCAVSCTGIGEQYIRHVVAYDVSALMAYRGLTVQQAVREVLYHRLRPGDGGIIAVSHDGTIAMDFTTDGMPRGAADSTGRFQILLGRQK